MSVEGDAAKCYRLSEADFGGVWDQVALLECGFSFGGGDVAQQ